MNDNEMSTSCRQRSLVMRKAIEVIGSALLFGTVTLAYAGMRGPDPGSAGASTSTAASRMTTCARLPLSERGMCKQEAVNLDSPTGAEAMSAQDRRAIETSNAAFERSVAACNRLPLSERGICKVQPHAANPVSIPEPQRDEMNADDARYRARLASCGRLPISERTTCASEAGRMTATTSG
jgi:hypothetical protein